MSLTQAHSGNRCWLLKCPLEIRRLIYIETFDTQVVFRLIDQKQATEGEASLDLLPISEQAPPSFDTDFDDLEELQLDEHVRQHQLGETQLGPQLAFRLVPKHRTPLLLVNKALHDEVKDTIDFELRKLKFHLASSVRGLWFSTLSLSAAIDLVQHSDFEFCCDANVSLAWLLRLDSRLSSNIQSLAIDKSNIYKANGRPHEAWQMRWPPIGGLAHAPSLRVLRAKLPGLQELAVWFPRDNQLCCWHDLCDMLGDGSIDTLRFLVDHKLDCPKKHPRFQSLLLSRAIEVGRLVQEYGANWPSMMHEAIDEETRRVVAAHPKFDTEVEIIKRKQRADPNSGTEWLGAASAVRFQRWT